MESPKAARLARRLENRRPDGGRGRTRAEPYRPGCENPRGHRGEAGRRVYQGTLAGPIDSLTEAKAAGNLSQRLGVLTHPAPLAVDKIGYPPVNRHASPGTVQHAPRPAAGGPRNRSRSADSPKNQPEPTETATHGEFCSSLPARISRAQWIKRHRHCAERDRYIGVDLAEVDSMWLPKDSTRRRPRRRRRSRPPDLQSPRASRKNAIDARANRLVRPLAVSITLRPPRTGTNPPS